MFDFLNNLDRRWIFLLTLFAVAIPILMQKSLPEKPTPQVMNVFDSVEELPSGSTILCSFDFDPASAGELQPMAAAIVRHCALKKHKIIFMTLWPVGVPMIQKNIEILENEFPEYKYGTDYVNLGYRTGGEGVIKLITTSLTKMYAEDVNGTSLSDLPLTKNLKHIQGMDLLVNISAGTPGVIEWVQYASTPFNIKTVVGCTGVTAPKIYTYIPKQITGMLGAIKGAAEYEKACILKYPVLADNNNAQEGLRRMAPQLVAHLLLITLIILGNVIHFTGKRKGYPQ